MWNFYISKIVFAISVNNCYWERFYVFLTMLMLDNTISVFKSRAAWSQLKDGTIQGIPTAISISSFSSYSEDGEYLTSSSALKLLRLCNR